MPFHLPLHKYIGPGTDDFSPQPLDSDDSIAQLHDNAYRNIRNNKDIDNADKVAVEDFLDDLTVNQNPHSLLGAAGLSMKRLAENYLTNQKYPKTNLEPDPSIETQQESPDSMMMNAPQAGGSIPGGTGSSVAATVVRDTHESHPTFTFENAFQITTSGFQFQQVVLRDFFTDLGVLFPDDVKGLTTPLAVINPNILAIYMTEAEYAQLPYWTYATSCEIKVTPLYYRLPFTTNEAASQWANSQVGVQIIHGVGINNVTNVIEHLYTNDGTDGTKPTAAQIGAGTPPLFDPGNSLYGYDGSIGCCAGVSRQWNKYLTVPVLQPNYVAITETSTPNLTKWMNIQNINDCKGTPVINYNYEFKVGMLKVPTIADQSYISGTGLVIPMGHVNEMWSGRKYNSITAEVNTNTRIYSNVTEEPTVLQGIKTNYRSLIDKASALNRQLGQTTTPDAAPLVTFGVMPLQSNGANAPAATFSNVAVQWLIQTKLHCSTNMNAFQNGSYAVPYLGSWDPSIGQSDFTTGQWSSTNGGVYISNRRVYQLHPYENAPYPDSVPVPLLTEEIKTETKPKRKTVITKAEKMYSNF